MEGLNTWERKCGELIRHSRPRPDATPTCGPQPTELLELPERDWKGVGTYGRARNGFIHSSLAMGFILSIFASWPTCPVARENVQAEMPEEEFNRWLQARIVAT